MGCCCSNKAQVAVAPPDSNMTTNGTSNGTKAKRANGLAEKLQSKQVDDMLRKDLAEKSQELRLLFLGAGESGKSTLFKQLVQIYSNGFSTAELQSYASVVYTNIIESIQALCVASDTLPEEACRMSSDMHSVRDEIMELKETDSVTQPIAELIQRLWLDPGIQRTYARRSRFQLSDGAVYFFKNIERIAQDRYVPTFDDILHCRARTTGIIDRCFTIGENAFRVYDVGGQRNERKKWLHCFENVTAVIFVASMSAYDQVLFEDAVTNRVVEALNLFHEISNSRWFIDTNIILFLNKRDIFMEKLATAPLTVTQCHAINNNADDNDKDDKEYESF
eukprot:TRINITY_DN66273_c10_g2_i2.p1 TRINITY_DN66273_c10_g2~~TRINITY_DN66273_c10_g2_i2.p1  ORF type:complete len:335 (+),score=142.80 TRINITY_DN66273_c10_g2_i2:280-1284(+)